MLAQRTTQRSDAALPTGAAPLCSMLFDRSLIVHRFLSVSRTDLSRRRRQSTQPQQVVGSADQVGGQLGTLDPVEAGFAEAPDHLHPAEDLLDAFALPLAHRVGGVAGGAGIEPRRATAFDARNVRHDAPAAQPRHKGTGVVTAIAPERTHAYSTAPRPGDQAVGRVGLVRGGGGDADIHQQPVAILHQRMRPEAEPRLFARALAHQFRLGIRGAFVGGIRARLAAEIDRGVARIIRRVGVVGAPGLKALKTGPGLDQRAVHGEVLIREQPFALRDPHHDIEELRGHLVFHQPLAVLGERRGIEGRLLQVHVEEPAKQDVVIEHLAEQPVRAHRIQRNQKTGLQQPLRRDRGPPRRAVHLLEGPRELHQGLVAEPLDGPQRMRGRHSRLGREVTEQMRLGVEVTAHANAPWVGLRDFTAHRSVHEVSFSATC